MNAPNRQSLGEQLLAHGYLSPDQLRLALREQQLRAQPLGELLVELGFISSSLLREVLSERNGQPAIALDELIVDARVLGRCPAQLARRHQLLPVAWNEESRTLTVATARPHDLAALDQLRQLLGHGSTVHTLLACEHELKAAIERCYAQPASLEALLAELDAPQADSHGQTAIVRLVDALLADAVSRGASDLHFEPEAGHVRIRLRLDGVLRQTMVLHRAHWSALLVRIKVMAGLDIAESRIAQDGRITRQCAGRAVDFRVSTLPTTWGENVVLRVLDRKQALLPLDALGFSTHNLNLLERMLARPEGLILVTGPTGSGKTTTLYSMLARLNREAVNIMTLEDPVEYPMLQLRQTSLNEVAKMDFADGVRAVLRQDPDIILIGEIRDRETADMALRAAMTGHQVFATLHTASALGALPRLLDLGLRPELLEGNLTGIIAQRLLRRLCPHCKCAVRAGPREKRLLGLGDADEVTVYEARGCAACAHVGYRGRCAVTEVVRVDAELDALIAARTDRRNLRIVAQSRGWVSLADEACRLVREGITSLDEALRVIDLGERLP